MYVYIHSQITALLKYRLSLVIAEYGRKLISNDCNESYHVHCIYCINKTINTKSDSHADRLVFAYKFCHNFFEDCCWMAVETRIGMDCWWMIDGYHHEIMELYGYRNIQRPPTLDLSDDHTEKLIILYEFVMIKYGRNKCRRRCWEWNKFIIWDIWMWINMDLFVQYKQQKIWEISQYYSIGHEICIDEMSIYLVFWH